LETAAERPDYIAKLLGRDKGVGTFSSFTQTVTNVDEERKPTNYNKS